MLFETCCIHTLLIPGVRKESTQANRLDGSVLVTLVWIVHCSLLALGGSKLVGSVVLGKQFPKVSSPKKARALVDLRLKVSAQEARRGQRVPRQVRG